MTRRALKGRPVIAGSAAGEALVSAEPISFWGGIDPADGRIIDRRHERCGQNVAGRVFVFPHGRGSSTASAILLESIRRGTAPAAIVNLRTEAILASARSWPTSCWADPSRSSSCRKRPSARSATAIS